MTYAAEVLVDSPFTYLRLNETSGTAAADSSGNGHAGTYTGTVTLHQTGRIADVGAAAVKLDGSSGYVSVPSTGVPTGNAAWTQEAVFRVDSHTGLGVVMAWGTASTLEEPNFYVDSSGVLFMSTWNTDTSVQSLTTGTWYHVATSWDGTTHKCYVNGSLITSSTPGTVATPASPAFTIGRNPNPSEFFGAFTIQEVAAYATCLSAARIAVHAQAALFALGVATSGGDAGGLAASSEAVAAATSGGASGGLAASSVAVAAGTSGGASGGLVAASSAIGAATVGGASGGLVLSALALATASLGGTVGGLVLASLALGSALAGGDVGGLGFLALSVPGSASGVDVLLASALGGDVAGASASGVDVAAWTAVGSEAI